MISVSTVVSMVLCDATIVDELVGFVVIVLDVCVSLVNAVSTEYTIKNKVFNRLINSL